MSGVRKVGKQGCGRLGVATCDLEICQYHRCNAQQDSASKLLIISQDDRMLWQIDVGDNNDTVRSTSGTYNAE